jgi:anti-anti-sigma factor
MEIVRRPQGDCLELAIEGRLDGYWAQHLSTAIDEVLREGVHRIRLNLAAVSYISSAGIRVLLATHQQFTAVEGAMQVVEPSPAVQQVLELAGLAALFAGGRAPAEAAREAAPRLECRQIAGVEFEVYGEDGAGGLACQVVGFPELLQGASFTEKHSHGLSAGANVLALGVGAFGEGFAACQDRFGEFLGVAGGVACQPTDGTNCPDYMLASGTFVPRLEALYGVRCEGKFGRLLRFESNAAGGPVPLRTLAAACLETAGAETAGMVIVAESAGLMGAALRRSPVARPDGAAESIFGLPQIRQWLSFSPQRCFGRALVLVGGVAATRRVAPLYPLLRPMGRDAAVCAHLHAAAFGYRPMQKGRIELETYVRNLFEGGGLQGVLHLLTDDREIAGAGESEFLRGACWTAPVKEITAQEVSA